MHCRATLCTLKAVASFTMIHYLGASTSYVRRLHRPLGTVVEVLECSRRRLGRVRLSVDAMCACAAPRTAALIVRHQHHYKHQLPSVLPILTHSLPSAATSAHTTSDLGGIMPLITAILEEEKH